MSRPPFVRRAAGGLRAYAPAVIPRRWGPRSRFFVLGSGRTGTRLLMELLSSQEPIACDYEILGPEEKVRFPFRYVQSRAARAGLRGAQAYGFKLLVHHVRELRVFPRMAFLERLAAAGYLTVVLTRRNLLRQAISWERPLQTGRHHYKVSDELDQPVHLDPAQLIMRMGLFEIEREIAQSFGESVRHLDVSYEDDLLDSSAHQKTVDRVTEALGLRSGPVRTTLKRGSSDDPRSVVSNWDEIADVVSRTRFSTFLTD